jgi:T5SS/PEP-CTERM-associated repeat protein
MKNFIFPFSSLLLTLPVAGLFGTTYTNSEIDNPILDTAGTSGIHTEYILDGYAFGTSSTILYVGSANSYIDLSILNAGSVTSQYGYLGYGSTSDTSSGSHNSVTITGTGSTWTNSDSLSTSDSSVQATRSQFPQARMSRMEPA